MDRHLILEGVRKAFCEQGGSSAGSMAFCFYSAGNDQFVLKDLRGIFWGKVFYGPLSDRHLSGLRQEYETLQRMLRENVRPVLFMPHSVPFESVCRIETVPASALFFDYMTSISRGECRVKLSGRKIRIPAPQRPETVDVDTFWGDTSDPAEAGSGFFKQGLLSRDELLELLEMSLDLVRVRPVG